MVKDQIKILIIDGSLVFRTRLGRALHKINGVYAVTPANDTRNARDAILQFKPDCILLALDLLRQDALPFLSRLREHYPVPVFVIAPSDQRSGKQVQSAFRIGALDAFVRPRDMDPKSIEALAERISEAVGIAVRRARPVRLKPFEVAPEFTWENLNLPVRRSLIAIGASTGGTEATLALLRALPPHGPPMLIVQHMPPGFTRSYADRLNHHTQHRVSEALSEQVLTPGQVLITPGDYHLKVSMENNEYVARTNRNPHVNLHRPSADVLFDSVATIVGKRAIGFILSGMGADGAAGLLRMRRAGALTFGQSRESSVVYGMPQAAADLGAVFAEDSPEKLPSRMAHAWRQRHHRQEKMRSIPAEISE